MLAIVLALIAFVSTILILFMTGIINFKNFWLETRQTWHGIVSSVEDKTLGLCYNKIGKKKKVKLFTLVSDLIFALFYKLFIHSHRALQF